MTVTTRKDLRDRLREEMGWKRKGRQWHDPSGNPVYVWGPGHALGAAPDPTTSLDDFRELAKTKPEWGWLVERVKENRCYGSVFDGYRHHRSDVTEDEALAGSIAWGRALGWEVELGDE